MPLLRRPCLNVCWLLIVGVLGCRHVPAELQLTPSSPQGPRAAQAPTDHAAALAAVLQGDPLARRVHFPPREQLTALEGTHGLVRAMDTILAMEAEPVHRMKTLRSLEVLTRGSDAVAISRGYRLALVESFLQTPDKTQTTAMSQALVRHMMPLIAPPPGTSWNVTTLLQHALGPHAATPATRDAIAQQWVLRGWLDGPLIALAPVRDALMSPAYNDLRDTEVGQLILARAQAEPASPDIVQAGMQDLQTATQLALQQSAADHAMQLAAWANAKNRAALAIGDSQPVKAYLQRALTTLRRQASDPQAMGAAIIALQARRIIGICQVPPCVGLLDTSSSLAMATHWHASLTWFVDIWKVIALKQSIDDMDRHLHSPQFHATLARLIDALIGTGASQIPADVFTAEQATPQTWAWITQSFSESQATSWPTARQDLMVYLAARADAAAKISPPSFATPLQQIIANAQP